MMKPWLRNVIFWSFLLFFFIAAPLSVFYTAGYRYNFQSGSVVRTGVISLNSTPRGAQILVNGEYLQENTPFIYKRVIPGEYEIELIKEGYRPWSGQVSVTSGATTLVQPITLFKDAQPTLLYEIGATNQVTNEQDQIAFLKTAAGWTEVWLYNTEDQNAKMVSRFLASEVTNAAMMTWSANGSDLLIYEPQSQVALILQSDGTQQILDEGLVKNATSVFWHPSSDQLIYLASPTELYQLDINTGEVEIFADSDAATVALDASVLTFVDNGTQIELRQSSPESTRLIALLPRSHYTIEERDAEFLVLSNTRGQLFLLNIRAEQPILLATEAHIFDWSNTEQALVYSDGFEIDIYYPQTHQTDFITRQGSQSYEQVMFHPDGTNIIVKNDHQIIALERYPIAQEKVSTTLVEDFIIEDFWLSQSGRIAYFYGQETDEPISAKGVFQLELTR